MHLIDTGKVTYGIRKFDAHNDIACVFATWCNYIRGAEPFNRMDRDEFRRHKNTVLERLVARHPPTVACHKKHGDQILGWSCNDPERNVVFFAFVKEPFREHGIGKTMLGFDIPWFLARPVFYTHKSKATNFLERKWKMCYNPYLVLQCEESLL